MCAQRCPLQSDVPRTSLPLEVRNAIERRQASAGEEVVDAQGKPLYRTAIFWNTSVALTDSMDVTVSPRLTVVSVSCVETTTRCTGIPLMDPGLESNDNHSTRGLRLFSCGHCALFRPTITVAPSMTAAEQAKQSERVYVPCGDRLIRLGSKWHMSLSLQWQLPWRSLWASSHGSSHLP